MHLEAIQLAMYVFLQIDLVFSSHDDENTFNYTLSAELLRDVLPTKHNLKRIQHNTMEPNKLIRVYLDEFNSTHSQKIHLHINLEPILHQLVDHKCFVVINNFQQVDFISGYSLPVILRWFDLAVLYRKKLRWPPASILWTPASVLPFLNGNFSLKVKQYENLADKEHKCPISKFFTSIKLKKGSNGYCVGIDPVKFIGAAKPWNCQVQIDLFMPDRLLKFGKYTQIFRYSERVNFKFVPGSIPSFNILLDNKSTPYEYDKESLISWMTRISRFWHDQSLYSAVTDIQMTGHTSCTRTLVTLVCKIETLNYMMPCVQCSNLFYTRSVKLENYSIESILVLDKKRNAEVFGGNLFSFTWQYSQHDFTLPAKISYFVEYEPTAIKTPLYNFHKMKVKYSDNLKMLAFSYSHLYMWLLGNVTNHDRVKLEKFGVIFDYKQDGMILDVPFESQESSLVVQNTFGTLRFITCGSKGLEPFPFVQFVSVFESCVWKWIFVTAVAVCFCVVHFAGRAFANSSIIIMCFVKVLLEQGDPFPQRLTNLTRLRYVVCGTLLAGLVISNAFKSTNVYNIVSPRHTIPYRELDELVADNFSTYSRIGRLAFHFYENGEHVKPNMTLVVMRKHKIELDHKGGHRAFGRTEVDGMLSRSEDLPEAEINKSIALLQHVFDYTNQHPSIHQNMLEPFDVLDPLIKVGFVTENTIRSFNTKTVIETEFVRSQNDLIMQSLKRCQKEAWILPDYLGQSISIILRKLSQQSNVGISTLSKSYLIFYYDGFVPTSLLQRISLVKTSGILEWWPKFIKRSDLNINQDIVFPETPKMSGNIQVIFIFLSSGLAVSIFIFIAELVPYTFRILKSILCFSYVIIASTFVFLANKFISVAMNFKLCSSKLNCNCKLSSVERM